MKDLAKFLIIGLAGFGLGWAAQSGFGIALRKARNRAFLDESESRLKALRLMVRDHHARKGRFPGGPGDLYASGALSPLDPPVEGMRRGAKWVGAFDGEGGFVYLSPTGELYLNADVSREKFFRSDWKRVLEGGLFPKGSIR